MEKIQLAAYSGSKHNRYNGYECSYGVLMALGASRLPDGFSDEDAEDPNDAFDVAFCGYDLKIGNGDNDDFRRTVLANLDTEDIVAIAAMENGDTVEFHQTWGWRGWHDPISIIVFKNAGGFSCVFDGKGPFEVTVCTEIPVVPEIDVQTPIYTYRRDEKTGAYDIPGCLIVEP